MVGYHQWNSCALQEQQADATKDGLKPGASTLVSQLSILKPHVSHLTSPSSRLNSRPKAAFSPKPLVPCLRLHAQMQGAFHGRTMGAMALTSSKTFYRTGFAPLMPQAFIAPFPYCLHCKARQTASDGKDWYKVSATAPQLRTYSQAT